jgi:hypothetical protein
MVRPRWHDAVIVAAILGLLAAGIWALWWDDVRHWLHPGPAQGSAVEPTTPQTFNPPRKLTVVTEA